MKKIIYTAIFMAGLFIGMVKGQDSRQKWVAKMKNKHEEKKTDVPVSPEVTLDEIELATYHS